MNDAKTEFAYSKAALAERKSLLNAIRALSITAALTAIVLAWPLGGAERWVGLAGGTLLAVFFWFARGDAWLESLAAQTVRVQNAAIELKRGKFTRFLMYSDISQLRVQRLDDDEVICIIMESPEGPLVIRGFEDMELIFGYVSARKPDETLVQIEDVRGWTRKPLIWLALMVVCAIAAGVLLLAV